ncbi:RNA-binding domain-containing protein [Canariomyces notabilis]|uniref:RNA-binding domain-containing protein n=1 Tax=Canariomyces notabilis TaxID=2074819 RepID=A0AAN6TPB1_9PEZI|nr:RNA-binding domain-containing protein [Canariomyces arenarius]
MADTEVVAAAAELQPGQSKSLAKQVAQPDSADEIHKEWETHTSGQIVVERLTKNVNEDHLFEIFGQYGEIDDLDLPLNRQTGANRGTAYILYVDEAGAQSAITHMHEAQLDGALINVSIVLPRRKLSPSPPLARRGANIGPTRGPPANFRSGPPGGPAGGRGWRSPAAPSGPTRYGPRSDTYRPRSMSRSRSPAPAGGGRRYRSRSSSYSSRSRSRTPPPGRGGRGAGRGSRAYGGRAEDYDYGARDRRRSRSYDSYESYDRRSRSPSRSRDRR